MTAQALLAAVLLVPSSLPGATAPGYHHDLDARACCLVIAHAGGGIDGIAYTNSEEAVLASLRSGARVFEIDFARTADGVWVGTHDWTLWRRQTGYAGALPPPYAEVRRAKLQAVDGRSAPGRYTAITLPFLERVTARHRDMVIVTDTKYDLDALARALRRSKLFERVYPQAYSLRDVDALAELGYRRIILTVYKMDLRRPAALLSSVAAVAGRLHALTVPLGFFEQHHAQLSRLGLPVYVHGAPSSINSRALHGRLRSLGASGFYLDW